MSHSPRTVSARARILGAILAVACVGLAIVGLVTVLVQRDRVLNEIDDRLRTQVSSMKTIAGALDDVDLLAQPGTTTATDDISITDYATVSDYLRAAVTRLVPARNEGSIAIVNGEARFRPDTLSGFDLSKNTTLIDRAVAETTRTGATETGTVETPDGTLRFIAIPVTMPGDPDEGVYVRAVNLDTALEPVVTSALTYAFAAGSVVVAIGIVGWFVTGRLLSPIRHLRDTADSITLAELGARIPTQGNDDISDLSRTVNSMLDRLETSVGVQRQLLDDVRHELKTPITIVRGHLELMDPADPVDVSSTRDLGIAELDRITRLVEDIDLLAAAEADQFVMRLVAIPALTDRIGELVAVIPGHDWMITDRARGTVSGDSDRLLQAWLALADNAAKYTPAGTPIEIGSTADENEVRLWVCDHGAGIAHAERHHIFRRFGRTQVRRTVGGSGLGLAIVTAIAKAHSGSCSVIDSPGGGATFTIHLPRSSKLAALPAPIRAGDVVLQREATQ